MTNAETLDRANAPDGVVRASLDDIRRANALFGGRRAVLEALAPFFATAAPGAVWTLADLGTGAGDIPKAAQQLAARHGVTLRLLGIDHHRSAARLARRAGLAPVVADIEALPLRPKSVDVVIMSQLLHHAPPDRAVPWIRLADGLARRAVVIADLRRSPLAALGIRLASFLLGFHPASRRDGVLSVRRGFTRAELDALLDGAGISAGTRARPGFRVVAAWRPVT